MAEISASRVMELRQRTGLGMMECKKALTEADGDLREGRGAPAHQQRRQGEQGGRRASRPKASSASRSRPTPGRPRWSKSTARPTSSQETTTSAPSRTRSRRSSSASNRPTSMHSRALALASGDTIEARRVALVQKIGENISLRRFARLAAEGRIASYVHGAQDRRPRRLYAVAPKRSARTSRCTSPPPSRSPSRPRAGAGRSRRQGARDRRRTRGRIRASLPTSSKRW